MTLTGRTIADEDEPTRENRPLYISNYVQMEMKRSYLMNIISFYFILRLDTINNIGDALALWSNRLCWLKMFSLFVFHQILGYRLIAGR